mgnify:CR=1 FL=1
MARYNNPRKTWQYSTDFKVKAVELSCQEGIQVQQVAAGLDIHPMMLSRWRKEYLEGKGRKRVERLMREASLVGRVAKLYRRVPGVERFYQRHKNLRLNMPAPTGVNQQWVADLTYIKVNRQWRYLTVMLDVYSRKVIGWSLGDRKTADLTLKAEVIHGVSFKNEQELRAVLRGYINHFYNQKRYTLALVMWKERMAA